jgi:hypothetical protein
VLFVTLVKLTSEPCGPAVGKSAQASVRLPSSSCIVHKSADAFFDILVESRGHETNHRPLQDRAFTCKASCLTSLSQVTFRILVLTSENTRCTPIIWQACLESSLDLISCSYTAVHCTAARCGCESNVLCVQQCTMFIQSQRRVQHILHTRTRFADVAVNNQGLHVQVMEHSIGHEAFVHYAETI